MTATARLFDPDTSIAAGAPDRTTDREKALRWHQLHPWGLTDFELADLMERAQTSAGKRRCELRDLGLVEDSGLRRRTPSGATAIVWRLVVQP
jgi:hypothetical protein